MDEDKFMALIGMTERSQSIPETELAAFFSDKETRAYYETMVMLKQSYQVRGADSHIQRLCTIQRNRKWPRYVATIVVALLSMVTIILAAVYWGNYVSKETPLEAEPQQSVIETDDSLGKNEATAAKTKKTYENERLELILSDIASYYDMEVKYSTRETPSLRLHFIWNPTNDIDTVIDIFNHFNHIKIQREGNILYVK